MILEKFDLEDINTDRIEPLIEMADMIQGYAGDDCKEAYALAVSMEVMLRDLARLIEKEIGECPAMSEDRKAEAGEEVQP
jgi:hypothetical protein